MCYRKDLEKMIENKFEILEKIRDISNQNKVRVSISMGIASWNIDYESLGGVYAQNAVELAESVVVTKWLSISKIKNHLFWGGKK